MVPPLQLPPFVQLPPLGLVQVPFAALAIVGAAQADQKTSRRGNERACMVNQTLAHGSAARQCRFGGVSESESPLLEMLEDSDALA